MACSDDGHGERDGNGGRDRERGREDFGERERDGEKVKDGEKEKDGGEGRDGERGGDGERDWDGLSSAPEDRKDQLARRWSEAAYTQLPLVRSTYMQLHKFRTQCVLVCTH